MSPGPQTVARRAHAKLNVFLRVLGARDDGFHDLESVVVPISLHDVVSVETGDGGPASVVMDVHGDWASEPVGERGNLASSAAELFLAGVFPDLGDRPAPRVTIGKWIPIAAGLGGGSADAAATLHALNELFACGWSSDELAELGIEVGSDVPAMLAGEPVLMTGRGERLVPVHAATTWWVVRPFRFPVAAADAYRWWDETPVTGPDPGVLIAALETGDVRLLGDALFNDLQPAVVARHPEIGEAISAFIDAGALGATMSGSGPTVAALASHVGHAGSLAAAVPGSIVVSGPPARSGAGEAATGEG
jgi:4-diphosphocytidyl-2-C-methyl-D-erythritol kinase